MLSQVLLLVRSVPRAVKFYSEGLGLPVAHFSDTWSLVNAGGVQIALKSANNESEFCTGYSPILNFNVSDVPMTVSRLLQMGAVLDGPIKYQVFGKIACVRTPDGHMIGLFEPEDDAPSVDVSTIVPKGNPS
eukprot:c3506_g1_i1.p1 GENE.c3506_g1_i1~~c3506_g1_i1.p1  ORF type:complete len:132 (+),score=15.60 c3506_g1_i1:55-450(+)